MSFPTEFSLWRFCLRFPILLQSTSGTYIKSNAKGHISWALQRKRKKQATFYFGLWLCFTFFNWKDFEGILTLFSIYIYSHLLFAGIRKHMYHCFGLNYWCSLEEHLYPLGERRWVQGLHGEQGRAFSIPQQTQRSKSTWAKEVLKHPVVLKHYCWSTEALLLQKFPVFFITTQA